MIKPCLLLDNLSLMPRRLLISFCCFLALFCQHLGAIESDQLIKDLKPAGSITDKADLLPFDQEQKLRRILDTLNVQTGAALVVVTLPSIEGGQIDDFTNRLFEEWGVGQAGKDNGVMLLVAVKERKMRIEVGYGLESVIPDGLAGSIREKYIVPYFRNGQMAAGIESGTLALADLIAQHYKIEISEKPVAPPQSEQNSSWPIFVFIFIFIIIQIIARIRGTHAGHGRRYYGGSGWHIGSSGGGFSGGSSFGGFGGGMSGGGGASGGW